MKISFNWLKKYVSTTLSAEEVGKLLTSSGLEVEEITQYESIPGGLKNVVIGHVLEKEKHPDADKLSVTKVDVGSEILQIVCGAPNVNVGQRVVVALVGAELTFTNGEKIGIKKSKIRGVESNGMICAEDELGIGESHEGILVLPNDTEIGLAASTYFSIVNDDLLDINLTPNRGDAYSHIGVARDVNAVLMQRLKVSSTFSMPPFVESIQSAANPSIEAMIESDKCIRYAAVRMKNIVVKPSEPWLVHALKSIGIKSINNIVDITNYVLHEYGQPIHAFDADKIKGNKIVVKHPQDNTPFITLDGQEVKLNSTDIIIADMEKALCIAGVYGGLHSGVSNSTSNILLESACFDATSIRKTATRLNLRTDAAMHFEKGADANIALEALQRTVQLIVEMEAGQLDGACIDLYPIKVEKIEIQVSFKNVCRLIGKEIEKTTIISILNSLQIETKGISEFGFTAVVPTFKTEVTREADIIEEILRIYGFDLIDVPKDVYASLTYRDKTEKSKIESKTASFLIAHGFYEMMTNPITQSKFYESDDTCLVRLANSMTSELDAMRQNMSFGGLESIAYNLNRKNYKLRFFEFGSTYSFDNGNYKQQQHLVLYMAGIYQDKSWQGNMTKSSFFHLKSFAEKTLELLGISNCLIQEAKESNTEYGVQLVYRGKIIASISMLGKKILKQFDIKEEVMYADIQWDDVLKIVSNQKTKYSPISKFPTVKRDLALVLNNEVTYEAIRVSAKKELKNLLLDINLFDLYKGEKVSNNKKSMAISFTLGDENKTLADKEIEKLMLRLISVFEKEFGAEIRS